MVFAAYINQLARHVDLLELVLDLLDGAERTLLVEVATGSATNTDSANGFIADLDRHAAAQQQIARDENQIGCSRVFLAAFHHGKRGVFGGSRGKSLLTAGVQRVRTGSVGALHCTHTACTVNHGCGHGVAIGSACNDAG